MNCLPDLNFSLAHRENRLLHGRKILGEMFVKRIIAYALFLLGANRNEIAKYLEIPLDTLLSFFTRINKYGPSGFLDRRTKPQRQSDIAQSALTCSMEESQLELHFGSTSKIIKIPKDNVLQYKTIVLTFLDNGIINRKEAARALNCSSGNADKLLHKIHTGDISCLIDKRKGQQKDYVFTPEIKSELILQFAANAATGKSTSSPVLADHLHQRTSLKLSERTIRYYISGLGLKGKTEYLRQLIGLKKTP